MEQTYSQLTIDFPIIPIQQQICMMCHFSSECDNCCNKCINPCNAGQACGLKDNPEDLADRLDAWIHIVSDNENFKHLRKYIKS